MVAVEYQTVRIEIWAREARVQHIMEGLRGEVARLVFIQGNLTEDALERLLREVLVDPVTEQAVVGRTEFGSGAAVDVTLLPGVTDPAAENLVRAAHLLGITGVMRAATGQRYILHEPLDEHQLQTLAVKVLSNPVIQRVAINTPISAPFVPYQERDDTIEIIALKEADDARLMAISHERRLSLDLHEMRAIRAYFAGIQRDPTDAEIEMLAQTWSEHCVHKTFKARVAYTGPAHGAPPGSEPVVQQIDGLLNTYIRAATDAVNKPWVRSAFVDNAGIIKFDEQFDLAFKVETHNRPSAIEPFGGANTGVGGVVRDVLGVSARPIANTDVLCFGLPDMPEEQLPEGVLHPRRIAAGVIAGIEDYGNKMGIPTVNGSITYHPGYTANPLVFCGCLGILPHGAHRTGVQAGDFIVVVGGRTGRDGLRGATFSSMEMDTTTSAVSGGAVQIGHPIHEKQVQEVVLRARDEGLYHAITDCGAGGLSSAVGEMGEHTGATVQLETVPLKYPGLRPWEIWLSEAQERMVLAVPPEHWPRLQSIAAGQDIDAVVIGTFEATGRLTLTYGEKLVGDIEMAFLHDGLPQRTMEAVWSPPTSTGTGLIDSIDVEQTLLGLLAMPTIRSKEEVIRRYDHEVQTGTALKPLVGVDNHGPGDAAVIVPLDTLPKNGQPVRGAALSNGLCPQFDDPYSMAWMAVDEALRNVVAVGADPDQVAILDNFSWGNTSLPDRMGALVRCAQGCYDAALAYQTPFISGKDSLNNEYLGEDGQRHAIPGTLVISALGIVPDAAKTATMDMKAANSMLFVVGETYDELGSSHLHLLHGVEGGQSPQPNPDALKTLRALYKVFQTGIVRACHDISEGGLAVALAEMCIAGRRGAEISLDNLPGPASDITACLFAESPTRFIVEVHRRDAGIFSAMMGTVPHAWIGQTRTDDLLVISAEDTVLMELPATTLEQAWRGTLGQPIPPAQPEPNADEFDFDQPTIVQHLVSTRVGKPRVLILHANGTNRDRDAVLACQLAGGEPEIVHLNQIFNGERHLLDYHMLVVPGGFSYGDDLGAGVLWALDLRERLGNALHKFIDEGRPVMGICNGFQTLVKAGVLPGGERNVTLTNNASGQFECRWVYLQANPHSPCLFTQGMEGLMYVPVAHGEGQVAVEDEAVLKRLKTDGLIALTYVDAAGNPVDYPGNPNGSVAGIAGLCNPVGNVFGLMPHPENHIFPWQHPRHHRKEQGLDGLRLFKNGIKFA
ncbi:MAG: hypothetical protein OHK0046_06140 [Anaerolineae bacterium]